ncbi:MAG: ATP-binding protein [Bacteroidales bacterium]|nr:ATP-binding protein [Bacteroidales bacterium]MCF8392192.1 ATP-binding protein [Bacteroidales bacterium]
MIPRIIEEDIKKKLFTSKAIIIYGARQTGKTTLVRHIVNNISQEYLWLSGDDINVREQLSIHSVVHLKALFGKYKLVVIDEAQYVRNIGLTLKLITDNLPDIQVIATGSSAFELANALNEPLTGRKWEYYLYPFSYRELNNFYGIIDEKGLLSHRLIYGSYPEVVTSQADKVEILNLLTSSYLYKDLFIHEQVKKPQILEKLVRALAFQVGSEVSYNELAKTIGADFQTVERYIDLLEKAYIVFRHYSLSRNLRNEIKKGRKIYFYDNGIRNAVIGNLLPVSSRNDIGALWENYVVSERLKYLSYNRIYNKQYFWRTHAQQEIDYIEEWQGKIFAYEIKWNPKAKVRFPKSFITAYPDHVLSKITPDTIAEFL